MHEHGVEVKVLSGDNDAVVRTIARQVGIDTTYALTGPELEAMDQADKQEAVKRTTVFSKLTPHQKTEIIILLQEQQNTVGFWATVSMMQLHSASPTSVFQSIRQ